MPIKTPETPQFNKAEKISSKMYDAADEIGAEQPELHQTFSQVANEFATENYDKGQRVLEKKGTWNDKVRGAVSEANQASREKNGAKPLTFDEAKNAINGYAKRLTESGELEDKKDAALIESIVSGMNRPGMDGMDEALEYIEGVLQTKSNLEQHMHPQMKKDWEEQRAVRDALFAEKQKRMEKLQQTQRAGEGLSNDRNRTSKTMKELYTTAGVPEDTPSRQGLLQRVKSMSPEEMHFLNAELGNIAKKFKETGDPKELDAALFDLTTKKFTKEEVHKRINQQDQKRLEEIRQSLDSRDSSEKQGGDHFYKILSAKELTDALDDPNNVYTKRKGAAAISETFKKLYPDARQLEHRLESLIGGYQASIELSRKNNPEKSDEAHQAFSGKKVMEELSSQERQAIEAFLEKNYQRMGGGGQNRVTAGYAFHHFLDFVAKINN